MQKKLVQKVNQGVISQDKNDLYEKARLELTDSSHTLFLEQEFQDLSSRNKYKLDTNQYKQLGQVLDNFTQYGKQFKDKKLNVGALKPFNSRQVIGQRNYLKTEVSQNQNSISEEDYSQEVDFKRKLSNTIQIFRDKKKCLKRQNEFQQQGEKRLEADLVLDENIQFQNQAKEINLSKQLIEDLDENEVQRARNKIKSQKYLKSQSTKKCGVEKKETILIQNQYSNYSPSSFIKWDITQLKGKDFVMKTCGGEDDLQQESKDTNGRQEKPRFLKYSQSDGKIKNVSLTKSKGGNNIFRYVKNKQMQQYNQQNKHFLASKKEINYNNVIFGQQNEENLNGVQDQFKDFDLIFDKKKSLSVTIKRKENSHSLINSANNQIASYNSSDRQSVNDLLLSQQKKLPLKRQLFLENSSQDNHKNLQYANNLKEENSNQQIPFQQEIYQKNNEICSPYPKIYQSNINFYQQNCITQNNPRQNNQFYQTNTIIHISPDNLKKRFLPYLEEQKKQTHNDDKIIELDKKIKIQEQELKIQNKIITQEKNNVLKLSCQISNILKTQVKENLQNNHSNHQHFNPQTNHTIRNARALTMDSKI